MASIIGNGRYRVVETLHNEQDYSAYKGIDIQSREHASVLVNRYMGEGIRRVLGDLYQLTPAQCDGFVSLETEQGSLCAIFEFVPGAPLCQTYNRKEYPAREEAYLVAESLLHRVLLLADLPPLLACAASDPAHVLIHRKSCSAFCRMLIPPDTAREISAAVASLSRCMELIFRRRFGLLDFELDFLDELRCGGYTTLSSLYAGWREVKRQWEEMREKYEKQAPIRRFLELAGQKWRRRKRAKAYKKRWEAQKASPVAQGLPT